MLTYGIFNPGAGILISAILFFNDERYYKIIVSLIGVLFSLIRFTIFDKLSLLMLFICKFNWDKYFKDKICFIKDIFILWLKDKSTFLILLLFKKTIKLLSLKSIFTIPPKISYENNNLMR